MVIGQDVTRLVVEASEGDVRRYAKGQFVDVANAIELRNEHEFYRDLRLDALDGRHGIFEAVMRTACGCEKRMIMPMDPPRDIRVAVRGRVDVTAFGDTEPQFADTVTTTVRRFARKEYRRVPVVPNPFDKRDYHLVVTYEEAL